MNLSNKYKKSLGICIGASTVSFVFISKDDSDSFSLCDKTSVTHNGNPKKVISDVIDSKDLSLIPVMVTGRKFRNILNVNSISEPEAIESSVKHLNLYKKYKAIASLGGENFIVYALDKSGNIEKIYTGNKCASGTGEFFLQQLGRMNLNLDDIADFANNEFPHPLSGRCSVFCKSDCTHALNKGIPKETVVSGLSKMIADKAIELLSKQSSDSIIVIGGITKNSNIIHFIRKKYPDIFIPDQATYFEAFGASLCALENGSIIDKNNVFKSKKSYFTKLKPLNAGTAQVEFKTMRRGEVNFDDEYILGLDVGSTTTKAVLIRESDSALIASVYLRTNGNPVRASIECYEEIRKKVKYPVNIIGLGTTGSGRQIAALHALTNGVINEIIAHSIAAAYFDKEVDTIFEIGGQDAKYTFLTNGVASDYAMNEACSAGTGSFLEEAAKESLDIYYKDIAEIAFTSVNPLNFNDQCSAFISSDIKNASHDGASKEDIICGIVYSICMNYINRVKGNRPVGKKVFMQGGVCYNKAVPFAMSNLLGKKIIVPPEPGLMGAFGVALEIKNRIKLGKLQKCKFDLSELIDRNFKLLNKFICAGGKEKCEGKCEISIIEVDNKKYPFGGACSKYYNQRFNIKSEQNVNYVAIRQKLVFEKYLKMPQGQGRTIGILKSMLTNTLYPLYYNFFTKLGFKVVLSDSIEKTGKDKIMSSYCYPVEISHGFFQDLINKNVDYIFLPHITQMKGKSENQYNRMCVFVQGESYLLRSTFREYIDEFEYDGKISFSNMNFNDNKKKNPVLISPVIDFNQKYEYIQKCFANLSKFIGTGYINGAKAFRFANDIYQEMLLEFENIGKKIIDELEKSDDKFAMVLFGRAYNAFAEEANLNIPNKISSKNILIIPHDFIPSHNYDTYENMYWFSGHQILRSARYVKQHKKLFGIYITNFSCGPDSFIISYFRNIMGTKPSLTLELDSHSADVGVDTRIDAAFDIINNYLELNEKIIKDYEPVSYKPLKIIQNKNRISILNSRDNLEKIYSSNLEVLIPSMGKYSSDAFSAVFRSMNINCRPMKVPTFETLKSGRGLTSCKECLPFILTTGSLVEYLNKFNEDKKILFFMPHGYGPCRQGQYYILLKDIINQMKLNNVGILSMDDEKAFSDFGSDFFIKQWIALIIADVIHDIESVLEVLASNENESIKILKKEWIKIIYALETGNLKYLFNQIENSSDIFSRIQLKKPLSKAKIISLVGEIYVRKEEYSKSELINILNSRGFIVKTAPITEYVYYSNYLLRKRILNGLSYKDYISLIIKDKYQRYIERKIKKIFAKSGLYKMHNIDIDKTMNYGKKLISEKLIGEGILTVGLSMREILDESCGVISIGPFNCIPSRLSEAILNKEMTLSNKYKYGEIKKNGYPEKINNLPFLYVETDGNPFPQITQSKIEIFMLQAEKLYELILNK